MLDSTRMLLLVVTACPAASRTTPASSTAPTTSAPASTPRADIVRSRVRWQPIAAAPDLPPDREPAVGLAVGRALLVHHRGNGWLAGYDPCERAWRPQEPLPQPLRQATPLAQGGDVAAICCGGPDRSGLLVDVVHGTRTAIPAMPRTPNPGRIPQPLNDGFLVPTDKRWHTRGNRWQVLPFDDAIRSATQQQDDAVASSGTHVLMWGGEQQGLDRGPQTSGDGALFDATKDSWHRVTRTGAPTPRRGALAIWTGSDFLVVGGEARAADGNVRATTDSARYDPTADRWQPVLGAPQFAGPLAATLADRTVLVWDAEHGGAYDLDTGRWRSFGMPAKVPLQDRPHGHGRLAVLTRSEAFVLDPKRLRWSRSELPPALHGRSRRVHAMTATHLVVWGGERGLGGPTGCENPPPGQGCDPVAPTATVNDGAALPLAACP